METRELLEAAARAAGMSGTTVDYDDRLVFLEDGKPASVEWNPLTDDGDALRLAVKLGIDIKIIHPRDHVELGRTIAGGMCGLHEDDPYAATRRTVVRAAAAIDAQRRESNG